jgi:anti-sigma factor RsiW
MNCDQAIEYLPWLLNGTLEATERDEVRRHLATCESCRAALNDTRDAWTIFGQHLPGDALVALAYGEIPAGVDPAVAERHLASCPECAAELELARTSRRLEEDDNIAVFPRARSRQEKRSDGGSRTWRAAALAAGLTGLVAGTGWFHEFQQAGSLAERLAQKPAAVQQTRPTAPPSSGATAPPQEIEALKGQLQVSQQNQEKLARELDAMNGKLESIEQTASAPLQPQVNAMFDSVSRDVERGGTTSEKVVPRDQPVTLSFEAGAEDKGLRDVEVLDPSGKKIWVASGQRRSKLDEEAYTIAFPLTFFHQTGLYTIQLYSNENGKRVKRESYKIRVE